MRKIMDVTSHLLFIMDTYAGNEDWALSKELEFLSPKMMQRFKADVCFSFF